MIWNIRVIFPAAADLCRPPSASLPLLLPPHLGPPRRSALIDCDFLCHGVMRIAAELQPRPKFGPRQGRAGRKTDGGRERSRAQRGLRVRCVLNNSDRGV